MTRRGCAVMLGQQESRYGRNRRRLRRVTCVTRSHRVASRHQTTAPPSWPAVKNAGDAALFAGNPERDSSVRRDPLAAPPRKGSLTGQRRGIALGQAGPRMPIAPALCQGPAVPCACRPPHNAKRSHHRRVISSGQQGLGRRRRGSIRSPPPRGLLPTAARRRDRDRQDTQDTLPHHNWRCRTWYKGDRQCPICRSGREVHRRCWATAA
jgi:hypothetical protein